MPREEIFKGRAHCGQEDPRATCGHGPSIEIPISRIIHMVPHIGGGLLLEILVAGEEANQTTDLLRHHEGIVLKTSFQPSTNVKLPQSLE